MKRNSELKIQYMSQENDRDLLLKQLIFHKKDNQRLRKDLETKKKEADEVKAFDDNTMTKLKNGTFVGGMNETNN